MTEINPQHYQKSGYVIVDDVITVDEQKAFFDTYAHIFCFQMKKLNLPQAEWHSIVGLSANLTTLFRADMQAYLAAAKLASMSLPVARAACSMRIANILRQLGLEVPVVSTKPGCHFMTNSLSVPGGYHKTPPHQDWRSMQGSIDSIVVWLALADVDENSYPLQIIPGSHTYGNLPTVPHPGTPMVNDSRIKEKDFVTLTVKARQAVVFSSFLVHRTSEQGDDRVRLAVSYRFNNAAEPTFITRNYPCPYKYSFQLDLLYPDFPDPADIARFFNAPSRSS